jgi:type I restriction enzyme S subunit
MNQAKMNSIPVALPPLAEQQRIVAKVDELMTLCDELAAAQSEREARRDRLVAATLHRLAASAADPTPFPERAHFYFTHLPRLTTRPEHIHSCARLSLHWRFRGNWCRKIHMMSRLLCFSTN